MSTGISRTRHMVVFTILYDFGEKKIKTAGLKYASKMAGLERVYKILQYK